MGDGAFSKKIEEFNKWFIYIWYFKIMKNPFRHPNFSLNYKEKIHLKYFWMNQKNESAVTTIYLDNQNYNLKNRNSCNLII